MRWTRSRRTLGGSERRTPVSTGNRKTIRRGRKDHAVFVDQGEARRRERNEGDGVPLGDANDDAIRPDANDGCVLHPIDGAEARAAVIHGKQVDAAARIVVEDGFDFSAIGVSGAGDFEGRGVDGGFHAVQCEAGIANQELFETMNDVRWPRRAGRGREREIQATRRVGKPAAGRGAGADARFGADLGAELPSSIPGSTPEPS